QIELEHPIVARGASVMDAPDRGQIAHLDRQPFRLQELIEPSGSAVPDRIGVVVEVASLRCFEIPQELVHGRHYIWVRVESAASEADPPGRQTGNDTARHANWSSGLRNAICAAAPFRGREGGSVLKYFLVGRRGERRRRDR